MEGRHSFKQTAYWSFLFYAFLYFEKKGEPPVCEASDTMITVIHILIERADLVELRKKYFEEKSLYLLFRNVNQENFFDFLTEIGVYCKI